MTKIVIFGIIGGLGLFLFGMKLLSEGLQKIAGYKLRQILKILTDKPIVGIFVGALVTAIIQSSSATTVMVVGFVNAGLMLLRQAIGVILGAHIGTTITAQIIAFKIDQYALPAIGLGFLLWVIAKRKNVKFSGQAILGFGILFLGLAIMKDVLGPLGESQNIRDILTSFSNNPLLGILGGMLVTAMVQSSSATIGLIMALAFAGLINLEGAIYLVLGTNIGTTVTAQIASIGANISARRSAMVHSVIQIIGVAYMLVFINNGLYIKFIEFITPGSALNGNILRHIANAHTVFNIINTIIFLPFIGVLEKISKLIIPGEVDELHAEPKFLEKYLLNTPSVALDQTTNEIIRMAQFAQDAVRDAMNGFFRRDIKQLTRVVKEEEAIDNLQKEITQYLVELSQRSLIAEESEKIPVLLHSVNDVERIGDHAENLMELAERAIEEKLPFSEDAIRELKLTYNEVDSMITEVIFALKTESADAARKALAREDALNRYQIEFRQRHIERLSNGKCFVLSGIIFMDLVNNLEKIGDHLTNITQAIIGSLRYGKVVKKII